MSRSLSSLAFVIALLVSASSTLANEHQQHCRYCNALSAWADPPQATNGRNYAPDRQVDVEHIKLDLTPDFDKRTIAGTATIRFAPISKPAKSLRLDAHRLDVSAVRSKHGVSSFSSDDESLTIVFEAPIAVGEQAEVEIDYSAEPVEGLYFRTAAMGLPKGDDHLWTQGEPHEARHWFPCFDYSNERASSEIICHVPEEMTVVSNGKLVGETKEDGGKKSVHWLQEKPHVSYLVCLIAGNLAKLEAKHRDVPLGFYTQPSKAKHAEFAFRDTPAIMAFYEDEIGVPYPWDKYDQATCADYHWGGMENTTITTLTQRTIYSDATENIRSSRSLDAHEMAHQWFGDYITCKDWSNLWLNEGFATYYALLYEGHKEGQDAFQYGLYLDARDDIGPHSKDLRPIVYRDYNVPRDQFDFRAYPKGSWVLHMLRSQFGDELYRKAIKTYLERHALGEVVTDDLRQVFEELSGKPLDRFFDQWVYHGGQPQLKVTYKWLPEEKLAHVTVEQTQEASDKVLLFEIDTLLRFIVDGKEYDQEIRVDRKKQDFYMTLPAEPQVVRFDPEYTLLANVDFDKSDKMLEAQLANAEDAIGRILACDELADVKTQAAVAALKKAFNEDEFFGVRCAAATSLRKIRTEEAVAALLDSTKQDDARVRRQVVEELGKCYRDDAVKQLLNVIETEKNPAIVATALRGLASHQGDDASATAKQALRDESWGGEPVGAALAVIRDLNDPSLASSVMETIKSREAELDPRDVSEAMVTVAKLSQKGKRQQEAFEFFVDYLNHPRQTLQSSAIRGLGELHDPAARPLLAPIAANKVDAVLAAAAKAALGELDQKTPLVPAEVGDLRKEVRELREEQAKLQKSLDELKEKSAAKKATGKKDDKPAEE
ncbi:M1 family aminopeptidase [Lacipirellula parvula]|uniref:Aminopeptidase N n=1 Tax=Lacipirellula parvula TaxID=2650471 RepID=A0A5K7XJL4_9BACT|nr:M1 family aminopeptidase [Lacipirellula parvula]BBO36585.1 hypothetical protein PLANPX_6197 [Lacipirellula parvula]